MWSDLKNTNFYKDEIINQMANNENVDDDFLLHCIQKAYKKVHKEGRYGWLERAYICALYDYDMLMSEREAKHLEERLYEYGSEFV